MPGITQAHALTATGIATAGPTVGTPVLTENTGAHALTADGIATGAPTVGTPVLSGDAVAIPKAETGGAMAGSGRWRRADDDTVFLRAKPATGRGSRTSPVHLETELATRTATGRGRTTSATLPVVVPLGVDCAHGQGRTRSASVKTSDIVDVLRVIELLTRKAA
jgi:hypothetical protein